MGHGNMPTNTENANRPSADLHGNHPQATCPEPWWYSTSYNQAPSVIATGNSGHEPSHGHESNNGQSLSNSLPDEDDKDNDVSRNSQKVDAQQQERNLLRDDNNVMSGPPTSGADNCLTQQQQHQPELVGHTIACVPNPYLDPYYGGLMAAYGPHPLQARMPVSIDVAQEPVCVNVKQYHGILRRRQSRAKAELQKKLIKVRKPYLHESRHQHAIRRARSTGGRFAKRTDSANGGPATAQSLSSSGSELMPADSGENLMHNAQHNQPTLVQNGGNWNEENNCSTQQWGCLSSNNQATSQRRFAM